MMHPIIEYAAIIWNPYTQSLINNLEAVQSKAARFVFNNYYRYSSVSEMLQQLGWPTLEDQRFEARATMIYKIINNLVHVDQRYLSYNLRNTRSYSLHLYHLFTNYKLSITDYFYHEPCPLLNQNSVACYHGISPTIFLNW